MFSMILSLSLLFALPETPASLDWNYTTDELSWTSDTNPTSFDILLYKNGVYAETVSVSDENARTQNLHDNLVALLTDASYTAIVKAIDGTGSSESDLSPANVKGMASLGITAQIEYGSDPINFIFNSSGSNTAFSYNKATTAYNHTTYAAAAALKITFPTTGQYHLTASHHGTNENSVLETITTFIGALVTGVVNVPLIPAGSATGLNFDSDTENNVLTIVTNPDNTGFKKTYTLRFRRRAENVPTSITGIVQDGNAFTCDINVDTSEINGDAISSLQEIIWSANGVTGTGYFANDSNVLVPLSNGDITVTATLKNSLNISATTGSITLSNGANWSPHLGKLKLNGKDASDKINIFPLFSSDPAATGVYSGSIVGDYSTLKLNLMAPSDCQVFIDGARVSSNGESILRVGPTNPITGPAAITYTIIVENSLGSKSYVLNIQREVNERLKFGRVATPNPHLKSADGDVFGMNTPATDKLTVQAWIRWTSAPSTSTAHANIASQTTSGNGSNGSFWLQHNNLNSSFEFAIKPTGTRAFVLSNPAKVTIERGIWYLVTGVYDGSNATKPVKIYVNNEDVTLAARFTSGNLYADPSISKFNIGKMAYSSRAFPGNIRNFRMWVGTARTLTQIAADYENTPLAGSGTDDIFKNVVV